MADNKATKSWVDSLSLLDEEGYRKLSYLAKWGQTNPEDDIAIVNNNSSGLVRAPKFGVKHLK